MEHSPTFFDPIDPFRLDGERPVEDMIHGDVLVAAFLDPRRGFERPGREDTDQGSQSQYQEQQSDKGLSGLFSRLDRWVNGNSISHSLRC